MLIVSRIQDDAGLIHKFFDCLQANELELALDVYNQLLREGCTPNLVTYNILIDVHGKTGQWQEAVKVLDALEAQVRVLLFALLLFARSCGPALAGACQLQAKWQRPPSQR